MVFKILIVFRHRALMLGLVSGMMISPSARAGFDLLTVGGDAGSPSILPSVISFRGSLGEPNNANNPGPISGGRREINWDGGGATTATSSGPTLTAFQNTRGATFTTPGTGFLQTPLDATELTSINAAYTTTFSTFSPLRIFTPVGSNITDVTFSLPGSGGATPATVSGFGVIFSDVDLAGTTRMEFFNLGGASIFSASAAPGTSVDGGRSLLGAIANAGEQIARVRITTGNSALGPADQNGNPFDVVVMDDVFYSEPVAIPEPASAVLAFSALAAAAAMISRSRSAPSRRR
jgi:hypothetical protein